MDKKMNFLYLVFILNFLTMCSQENKEVEYYSNGNIKSEWFPEKGLLNEYHENGNIKLKQNFKDGKAEGLAKWFYSNGNLKEEGYFKNDKYIGWASYYTQTGIVKTKRHYLLVDTASYLNEVIYFDEKGDTLKEKSSYFTLHAPKDTISLGEEFLLTIKLDAPYLKDKMAVFIADFDSIFYLPDTALVTIRVGHNFLVNYSYVPSSRGSQELRGFISDHTIVKEDTSEYTDERILYFSKEFFVK